MLKHLQTETCPFANLPEKKRTQWALTREEMKNCIWLKPQLVAQIELPSGRRTAICGILSSAGCERISRSRLCARSDSFSLLIKGGSRVSRTSQRGVNVSASFYFFPPPSPL